jgi:PT repeat
MCKFFTDVFLHFFSADQGFETQGANEPTVNKPTNEPIDKPTDEPINKLTNEPINKPTVSNQTISTVSSSYSKGLLNPLLKETISRIVCIDSQFRDD